MRYVGTGTVMIFALFSFKTLCLQGDAKKGMDRVGFETSLKVVKQQTR